MPAAVTPQLALYSQQQPRFWPVDVCGPVLRSPILISLLLLSDTS